MHRIHRVGAEALPIAPFQPITIRTRRSGGCYPSLTLTISPGKEWDRRAEFHPITSQLFLRFRPHIDLTKILPRSSRDLRRTVIGSKKVCEFPAFQENPEKVFATLFYRFRWSNRPFSTEAYPSVRPRQPQSPLFQAPQACDRLDYYFRTNKAEANGTSLF